MFSKKLFLTIIFTSSLIYGRDAIVEFKGAGFFPTNKTYKDIYGKTGTYGLEGSVDLGFKNIYGFASINFLQQKGRSLGLSSTTKISLIELGVGLKYLLSFCYGDVYAGLGFQPVHVRTKDCSTFVRNKNTQWGFGGIAKFGILFDLPYNLVLDLFTDYSFVNAKFKCSQAPTGYVQPNTAHLNAAVFGLGLGYRFG